MNEHIEQELFPFYALDALTEQERAEVEAYVAADPAAKERLDALLKISEQLPYEVEPIQPSTAVKENLLTRVRADERAQTTAVTTQNPPSPKPAAPSTSFSDRLRGWYGRLQTSPALPALAGVCVLLAILAVGWAVAQSRQQTDLQTQIADLSARLAALNQEKEVLQAQNAALQQQIDNQDQMLAAYRQPGAVTLAIGDATGDHPEATGTLTLDPETETAVFVAANLGQLAETQVYQLWLIRGDTPVSAGLLQVDESGGGVLMVDTAVPGTFDAIGLTIEPAGGSQSPTLEQIILLGSVSS